MLCLVIYPQLMDHPFLLILETDRKRFFAKFNRNKILFSVGLLFRMFLLLVLFEIGYVVKSTLPGSLPGFFFLTILIIDWVYKYLMMNVNLVNISFFIHLLRKKHYLIYVITKIIISFYSIAIPFIFLGYGETGIFLCSIFISVFNSFSVFVVKNFNKLNILIPVGFYFGIFVLEGFQMGTIVQTMVIFLICSSYIFLFYKMLYKNISIELLNRYRLFTWLPLRIDKLHHSLFYNEFLLYIRNKRTRIFFVQGLSLFFVGFVYLYNDDILNTLFLFEISLLFTGAFLITFWQFFLALDSSYFSFLLTFCNVYKIFNSKIKFMYGLLTVYFIICMIVCIMFFPDKFLLISASYLYNIGINTKIMLWFGFYNKSGIKLNKSPLLNYEGLNQFQFITPVILFFSSSLVLMALLTVLDIREALFGICILGIMGLLLDGVFLRYTSIKLNKMKYKLLTSYNAKF